MIRFSLSLTCAALLALSLTSADAQDCRARQIYHAPTYVSPTYHAQAHQTNYYAPYAVKVAISPDYYYSVADYYKDSLTADAAAFRVLKHLGKASLPEEDDDLPKPAKRLKAAAKVAKTGVPNGLEKIVAVSCLDCHKGASAKAGLDLTDLSALSRADRLDCYTSVNSGKMPDKGQPLPDADVRLFYDWSQLAPRQIVSK